MTDKEYWSIADKYEELNKDNQSYVPKRNWKALATDICKTNYGDYSESLADLGLFRYEKRLSEVIPEVCLDVLKKLCKEE